MVEAIGSDFIRFVEHDAIFGMNDWFSDGANAEFCVSMENDFILKPASLSLTHVPAVPIAALAALQGLVQHAHIR